MSINHLSQIVQVWHLNFKTLDMHVCIRATRTFYPPNWCRLLVQGTHPNKDSSRVL